MLESVLGEEQICEFHLVDVEQPLEGYGNLVNCRVIIDHVAFLAL